MTNNLHLSSTRSNNRSDLPLHQQTQIQDLMKALVKLEKRVSVLEAQLKLNGWAAEPSVASETWREIDRITRDALRHVDDMCYLSNSDLASLVSDLSEEPVSGAILQRILKQAIRSVRLGEKLGSDSRPLRYYDVLRLTYLEDKKVHEIAKELSISERQYYRELKLAVRAVADHVLSV
jgi:hypothetical protein